MSILIHNCTAVLMDEAGTVLPGAYVAVEGSKIVSVGAQRPAGDFETEIDGKGGVLMPGFVNAHTHVPMTAMRGYGDGNNLQDWLNNYIFPVEATVGRPGHPGLHRPGPGGDDRLRRHLHRRHVRPLPRHRPGGGGQRDQRQPVGGGRAVLRRTLTPTPTTTAGCSGS